MFEDKALADKAVHAVEKVVNDDDARDATYISEKAIAAVHDEHVEQEQVNSKA